ncbi:MAG: glycosyltransferase WbuB [Hyphomicrobiales bacterium]|nr:MAG: glycosyltransferase WbuB [Hyphomicrobiales bacterium]
MRLIFLNRFFWPDRSATSQMLSDIAFALARDGAALGRDIVVITSRLDFEDPENRLPPSETRDGVRIVRVWTSRFGRYNLLGRAIDYLTFYLSAALALWRAARRGDIVVAKTDPPMLSVLATPIARLRGATPVNWLQDIYPEIGHALGVKLGPLEAPLRALRNWSLKTAKANVVLGERMAERVAGLTRGKATTVTIPNWADGKLVHPVQRETNTLRRAWALETNFVVAYSGNLGRAHDRATMLDAIAILEAAGGDSIRWLFIGGGKQLRELKAETETRQLRSVLFQAYQPREVLAESLSAADVHLVTLRPDLEGLIVPSKIYGILAAGRPAIFIGDKDGEIGRLLDRADCGVTVAEGDAKALAATILAWSQAPQTVADMGQKARALFTSTYDLPFAVQRWKALMLDVARR